MLYVDNDDHLDPRINLALEEFLLLHLQIEEPLFLFYINEPSVIVGRNQNVLEEVDLVYLKENNIHLVRRLSGGGTVYHDLGNLNYSFVTSGQEGLHDFDRFTGPVIRVLREMGVEAELHGRSDIFVGGKKISGNAQYASHGRMFSHGTLLFNSDIEKMVRAIHPRQMKIESKAVQSVRSSVINIHEVQPAIKSIKELRDSILLGIFASGPVKRLELSEKDWRLVYQISDQRYKTWEWNVGRSPRFHIHKFQEFVEGRVDLRIEVDKGLIRGLKIDGPLWSKQEIETVEKLLVGVRYDPDVLSMALKNLEIEPFHGSLTRNEFLGLLY